VSEPDGKIPKFSQGGRLNMIMLKINYIKQCVTFSRLFPIHFDTTYVDSPVCSRLLLNLLIVAPRFVPQ